MLLSTPFFHCYFGDARDALEPSEYLALSAVQDILSLDPFAQYKVSMQLCTLTFLRQTHSDQGVAIADSFATSQIRSFSHEGDYLITNQTQSGIGVMTADCLPVILVDTIHGALGIAHAGWRGAVAGISVKMLKKMGVDFGSSPDQIQVFFGPAAQRCCYTVSSSFLNELTHLPFKEEVIFERNGVLYFDTMLCNKLLLQDAGVKSASICDEYTICTICDHSFYSHRRGDTGRQMTVVSLR